MCCESLQLVMRGQNISCRVRHFVKTYTMHFIRVNSLDNVQISEMKLRLETVEKDC